MKETAEIYRQVVYSLFDLGKSKFPQRQQLEYCKIAKGMVPSMKASLTLEDRTVFEGTGIGSAREVISEVVFNTSIAGYLEVLTDPSCAGQAVIMAYPLIGNYGICHEDMESKEPWPNSYIVRELSRIPSNFRSENTVQYFLETSDISGISGIDIRAPTKILREKGTMNGMITTNGNLDVAKATARMKSYVVAGVVKATSCKGPYVLEPMATDAEVKSTHTAEKTEPLKTQAGRDRRVALLDLGTKNNIAQSLIEKGCEVTIYPSHTTAEETLNTNPDGITLSNGPEDPRENVEVISEIRRLHESNVPIFAIHLGHQLMALATGTDAYELKYGRREDNRPVKDLETGRVYIPSQNHGYAVDMDSLDPKVTVPTFVNVGDGTSKGLKYAGKNIFIVQYHPETCLGPQNSSCLFDRFLNMMEMDA